MKVLSIKEPYASLIKDGYKCYETRSFKTNYRGELYIHASLSKCNQSDKLSKLITPMYGEIICKCMLVDCIYMTDEFIEKVKLNNEEYISGIYARDRYAWILKNIEILDKPIKAKGHLGIWNFVE